jgi:putative FmdB family regulatory protein
MPTYEYECDNCNKTFEVFQKITDVPLKKCPKCNKKISRLIGGGSGVIFKGSGFYATDYRKPGAAASSCSTDKKGCPGCPHAK